MPVSSDTRHFKPSLFTFLRELEANNDRSWFEVNRERYLSGVQEPAQRFISDFGDVLQGISPHFQADPRPNRGSLFRIYRDVRFSKDKSPYKTHAGIQFRHKRAKDAHAPGFYLHLEPGTVFVGVGTWHPDREALEKIRQSLIADPTSWKSCVNGKRFREHFELSGESLKRPPRGYDAEHPLAEDLKRKDFIAVARLTQQQVTAPGFLTTFTDRCKAGAPLMRFLCDAVGVEF